MILVNPKNIWYNINIIIGNGAKKLVRITQLISLLNLFMIREGCSYGK